MLEGGDGTQEVACRKPRVWYAARLDQAGVGAGARSPSTQFKVKLGYVRLSQICVGVL